MLVVCAIVGAAGLLAARIALASYRGARRDFERTPSAAIVHHPEEAGIAGLGEVAFPGAAERLAAWYVPARNRAAVVLVHGTNAERSSLLPETAPLEKNEFGCFNNDAYCARVKALPGDRNTLLVCGMESHICVAQTVMGALNSGYLVHVASDAVSSRTEWNWKIGLDRMRAAGAVISSTEMMIYELLRTSSGPSFKEMLQYLK